MSRIRPACAGTQLQSRTPPRCAVMGKKNEQALPREEADTRCPQIHQSTGSMYMESMCRQIRPQALSTLRAGPCRPGRGLANEVLYNINTYADKSCSNSPPDSRNRCAWYWNL